MFAGLLHLEQDALVLTTCDGSERVFVTAEPSVLAPLRVGAKEDGHAPFVLVEGERFRRTEAEQTAGVDGSLEVGKIRVQRVARDADCDAGDLESLPTLPREATWTGWTSVEPPGRIASSFRGDLSSFPATGGWGLAAHDLAALRVLEGVSAWCATTPDGPDAQRPQGHRVQVDVQAEGRFVGRWTVSCGMARSLDVRVPDGPVASVPVSGLEGVTQLEGPTWDLTHAGPARGLMPWLQKNPPACAGEVCAGDALPSE